MSYELSISENCHFLICKLKQAVTSETSREFSPDVDQLSRKHKIKRVLFDARDVPNLDTAFGNYD